MRPGRYIRKLSESEVAGIRELYRHTGQAHIRTRCQMVLLSAEGRSVAEIAQVTFFDEDTVLRTFDRYEAASLEGLEDRPRSGRPPKSH